MSAQSVHVRGLRPEYQRDDVARIRDALKRARRVLYVLPTGGGKTTVACFMVEQWMRAGSRILILVHRRELLEQMYRTLARRGDEGFDVEEESVGVIWRNDRRTNPEAPIQIASIDTLIRRVCPPADVVVLDEAHRSVANKWRKITDGWYRDAKILGLTATPERLDGKPLREAFDEMVQGPSVSKLIEMGFLRMPRCFVRRFDRRVDTKGLRVTRQAGGARDFQQSALEKRATRRKVLAEAPKFLREHGEKRNGCVFACGVRHAKRLVTEINADGCYEARLLTGATAAKGRASLLDPGGWLDKGQRRVVVTCDVLNEGFDLPSMKLAVLVRPTLSHALYLHQVGRILRPTPRNGYAPIILDLAGNVLRHAPPQEDRDWSLDAKDEGPKRNGRALSGWKRCPACDFVCKPAATKCPECGAELPAREPEERNGRLIELLRCQYDGGCSNMATRHSSKHARYGQSLAYCDQHKRGVAPTVATQTVCAGWLGPCPQQCQTPSWAFQEYRVAKRRGEPWRCFACSRHAGGAKCRVPLSVCWCGKPATVNSSQNARAGRANPYCEEHAYGRVGKVRLPCAGSDVPCPNNAESQPMSPSRVKERTTWRCKQCHIRRLLTVRRAKYGY